MQAHYDRELDRVSGELQRLQVLGSTSHGRCRLLEEQLVRSCIAARRSLCTDEMRRAPGCLRPHGRTS
jgi:hypothetical protein